MLSRGQGRSSRQNSGVYIIRSMNITDSVTLPTQPTASASPSSSRCAVTQIYIFFFFCIAMYWRGNSYVMCTVSMNTSHKTSGMMNPSSNYDLKQFNRRFVSDAARQRSPCHFALGGPTRVQAWHNSGRTFHTSSVSLPELYQTNK